MVVPEQTADDAPGMMLGRLRNHLPDDVTSVVRPEVERDASANRQAASAPSLHRGSLALDAVRFARVERQLWRDSLERTNVRNWPIAVVQPEADQLACALIKSDQFV